MTVFFAVLLWLYAVVVYRNVTGHVDAGAWIVLLIIGSMLIVGNFLKD